MSIHERLGYNFPQEHTLIQLVNMGSTCYINSILQSLYNIPNIQKYLEDVDRIIKEVDMSIESTLFGLFVKIYIDSQRAPQNEVWYEPNYFLDKLFSLSSNFYRNQMGDSYEFFLFLYRQFDKEITSINRNINIIRNSPSKDDDAYNDNNPIHSFSQFFDFNVANKFNPEFRYYRKPDPTETFNLIPINPEPNGIDKAISDFQKNPYFRKFLSFPEILVIKNNILGIDHDGNYYKNFVKSPIPFQVELTVEDAKAAYLLYAVVMHIGDSASGGHYMTVVNTCGRIIVFDDADIWELNDDNLINFIEKNEIPGRENCSAIYMLFYQKLDK